MGVSCPQLRWAISSRSSVDLANGLCGSVRVVLTSTTGSVTRRRSVSVAVESGVCARAPAAVASESANPQASPAARGRLRTAQAAA